MKKVALALLFLIATTLAAAADSFSFTGFIDCPSSGADVVISWPGGDVDARRQYQEAKVGTVGAGNAPTRNFIIVGVEVSHQQYSGTNPTYYTLVGKFDVAGTGGDYISSRLYGQGSAGPLIFPPDLRPMFKFNSALQYGGDQLHIHTSGCGLAVATIFYILAPQ